KQTIRGKDCFPKGPLRIGTLETTAAIRLPQIVARYGKRHPEVDLSLATGTTGSLSLDVLAYRLEGAFVAGPTLNPGFFEETVFVEELMVVSSPRIKDLRQLAETTDDVKILVFREGCSYRNRLESILRAKGVRTVRVMEFGTLDGILGCAGAGLGITLL